MAEHHRSIELLQFLAHSNFSKKMDQKSMENISNNSLDVDIKHRILGKSGG